jgi:hypothetical protein
MQATPSELPDHEGNIWTPQSDSNTPNAETTVHGDHDPVSGINLFAKLGLQIGKVAEQVQTNSDRVAQLARALERNTPVMSATVASVTTPRISGTNAVINLGSPDQGTFWEVSSWAIGGVDATDIVGCSFVGLYTGSLPTVAGAGLANMIDIVIQSNFAVQAFPFVNRYSTGQVVVHDQETLFAVLWSTNISQTWVSNVQYRAYNVVASQGAVTFQA